MVVYRLARNNDAEFLFQLRNEPSVRKSAFQEQCIEWAGHLSWFHKKMADKNVRILIAEQNGIMLGQIRLDCMEGGEGEVDFAVSEKYRGQGIGKKILQAGSEFFFENIPELSRIVSYVKKSNQPSIRSFLDAGFGDPQEVTVFNQECVKLTLNKPQLKEYGDGNCHCGE